MTANLTVANNVGVRVDQFYTNFQPGPGWNDGPNEQRMQLNVQGAQLRGNTVQVCRAWEGLAWIFWGRIRKIYASQFATRLWKHVGIRTKIYFSTNLL